jgi:hypothetical protein
MMELDKLLAWLGPAGTKAGILASELSLAELVAFARSKGFPVSPKPTRVELAHELAYSTVQRIDRPIKLLLEMNAADLSAYFKETRPTRAELVRILDELGVSISSEANKNLVSFAAREISDLGMYERVSQGHRSQERKPK